ncbi:sigma-70 family RNA polymerase sigma factor [Mucilaginibacter limnophilus]|uniref:Sigma-70 family RNA polymerase sigma factor n=1 Tax=Mucilaginibacter limnophilus TaxID=1932778 RepID=A0A3S2ULY0_9SPHI|nr:sigma-70 family RNA polymerase sigma factor [Mucilaginibacter limnophilus]RVT97356.1 sigma-70 family RNA polymerase sigma factor [Mucilaginibacter limnophilus]
MGPSEADTDVEMTALLKSGNVLAFTRLYHKYSLRIYANVLKMVKDDQVAEEITQVLFARIWQKRESITYERDFDSYLYRAGANLVCDFYRKMERDRNMSAHFKLKITEQYSHIEENIYYRESETLLEEALAKLSPQQRLVYQLCKLDGCSYKETAEKLGISTHTVKEYLSKAKNLVRLYMTKNMEIVTLIGYIFYIALFY